MKNIRVRSVWLRVALLLSEISRSIGSLGVVCKINKATQRHECLFTIIIFLKRKRSVCSIKAKYSMIL